MTKRSECRCECHSNPLITHFVPCCEPDPVDVHAYRKPIADDCTAGICSMNNCAYPHCSPTMRVLISLRVMRAEDEGRIMDGNPRSSMQGILNQPEQTDRYERFKL